MALSMRIHKKLAHFNLELDLHCPAGELLALIGPSGSGKTTAIRILAGLEKPDSGFIHLQDQVLCDLQSAKRIWVPTPKRSLGYVFQEASLFPHLRVRENISFGCKDPQRVAMLLELLGIDHLQRQRPHEISGGERQRVAFAQALAPNPKLLLLDEPFSALDITTRKQLRDVLLLLKSEITIPMVMVTHDLEEAALLGDQVVAIEQGKMDTDWLTRNTAVDFQQKSALCLCEKKAA